MRLGEKQKFAACARRAVYRERYIMRMVRIFEMRYGVPEFAQLIALGEIRRHHQDDFEGSPIEGLGLPALPAALPLAAMKFQRNDDREQRRDCPRLCLFVQHSATIAKRNLPSQIYPVAAGARIGPRKAIEFRSTAARKSANHQLPHQPGIDADSVAESRKSAGNSSGMRDLSHCGRAHDADIAMSDGLRRRVRAAAIEASRYRVPHSRWNPAMTAQALRANSCGFNSDLRRRGFD